MPVYSVIVPCYNEEPVLRETHKRLTAVLSAMDGDYEIVYVNDGSRDHTPDILNDLAAHDPCVRAVHFARNAGHQMAVTAGLDYATGDAIVIIDADLQDPPEIIPEMAAKWRAGAQVVYGQRNRRAGESAFKKFTAFAYYRLLRAIIADGQRKGEISMDSSVNEIVKTYALCERALMYDWCLCGGDYSLADYSKKMLPVFLSAYRAKD